MLQESTARHSDPEGGHLLIPALLTALLSIWAAGSSSARVWHVPEEIGDIQLALDFAGAGDTVSVAAGAYHIQNTITMHKPRQVLMSEWLKKASLIGENYDTLIRINAAGCELNGFNLLQFIRPIVEVTDNCVDVTIAENYIEGGGWGYNVTIFGTHTVVRRNQIRNCVIETFMQAAVIEDNDIGWIGGVFAHSDCTIRGNMFTSCISGDDMGHSGRGAAIQATGVGRTITISGNRFTDCSTIGRTPDPEFVARGGAVFLEGCGDVDVRGNRFERNQATLGGGLYARNTGLRVHGNLFLANTDSSYFPENPDRGWGGAIYLDNCTGLLDENTIARNVGMIDGGGIFVTGSLSPLLERNIYYRNRSAGVAVSCAGQASSVIRCCDSFGNSGSDYGGVCSNAGGDHGNFSADPLFCDESAPEPDYSLHRDSPCMPDHTPDGCGLVGAYGVGSCSEAAIGDGIVAHPSSPLQVFPNPCRGRVDISLRDIARDGFAIEIFDAAGRRMRTFPSTPATWDGRDGRGRPVGDGVYFVRVIQGDGREFARSALVLVR